MRDIDVYIDYINHRGERAKRRVRPAEFGFHPEGTPHHAGLKGWYMKAYDYAKQDYRDFRMQDIQGWTEAEPE